MNTEKRAEGTNYRIVQNEEGRYALYDGELLVTSPGGTPITTTYEELADAFLRDLEEHGLVYEEPDSILCWHYELLDKFISMNMKQILITIISSLMNSPERDWTFNCPYADESIVADWEEAFGTKEEMEDRLQIVADWLNSCTRMQLTAANAISKAFGSFNVAYLVAYAMEHEEREADVDAKLQRLAEAMVRFRPGTDQASILRRFGLFRLYYGFHMEDLRRTDPIEGDGVDEEAANELLGELLPGMSAAER